MRFRFGSTSSVMLFGQLLAEEEDPTLFSVTREGDVIVQSDPSRLFMRLVEDLGAFEVLEND